MFGLVPLRGEGLCKKIGAAQISLSQYYERNKEQSEILSTPGSKVSVRVHIFHSNFCNEF
jgi:hypothetical protein